MVAKPLRLVLDPAYKCTAFDGPCATMRYDDAHGLFPRGYTGATGSVADIALVLCVAEPGEPSADAKPIPEVPSEQLVDTIATNVGRTFQDGKSAFHANVRFLLDCCWPDFAFDDRMRRTWITEGVLCSALKTTGHVSAAVERECASRYLKAQLELLPHAFVIALGKKADRRIKLAGRKPDATVFAAGLPGGNHAPARPSWIVAGASFRAHLSKMEKANR